MSSSKVTRARRLAVITVRRFLSGLATSLHAGFSLAVMVLFATTLVFALTFPGSSSATRQGLGNIPVPPLDPPDLNAHTLEDFTDIVTLVDLGFNDFSGNMGLINQQYASPLALHCPTVNTCGLRFNWGFTGDDQEVFTGLFLSVFGLTNTMATFDGSTIETIHFPEHSLDFDQIDGTLKEPKGPRRFLELCMDLSYQNAEGLALRVELKDTQGGIRFTRLDIPSSQEQQKHCWNFREAYQSPPGSPDLDLHQVKELVFIVERQHIGDAVRNPENGMLDIHHIRFIADRDDTQPGTDEELLDLMERRAYQYFLDWSSRKPDSFGIPQDRSTFGDLLTVGGIGFGLPAHIIAAERGWISRTEAITQTLEVLRVLDNPGAFGHEPVGHIGYNGWFYHFLGVDGRRKLNFDFAATPPNEALNTVELSTIDTGLALMGVLAAQSYFDDHNNPAEKEIRERAQAIYDRVDWQFMLEPNSQQFYLGWKPDEERNGPPFEIPDGEGNGSYSGTAGNPATLDFYTDEALIVALLAIGSKTHPVPSDVYHALALDRDEQGLIRTYPGSLFTYQFLHAFLDTRSFRPSCLDQNPSSWNWFANSRQAIARAIQYAEENPGGFPTYGSDAWGVSAAEGPFDQYHAYGVPPLAINQQPEQDGTIGYYPMLSAVSYGADLRAGAISALQKAWERGHWHPRFGLPDAFNADISWATPTTGTLRQEGPWLNRALFAIDQGPMLLHMENARSGLIWRVLQRNLNIRRALQRLEPYRPDIPVQLILEGEDGSGDGQVMLRSNASGQQTVWLDDGESRTLSVSLSANTVFTFTAVYSNDNFGPLETVEVSVDGNDLGQFMAEDTGDFGAGWNVFKSSGPIGSRYLAPGPHEIVVSVSGGDGHGVEIDALLLDFNSNLYCIHLPVAVKSP